MSIEGLGRKFQEARKARNLSLEEAARLTRIRQSRLAEIEAEDFSNFPSLAYAKGFLQIYGKFLDVDVSPYLDAFETSGHLTVDGYSYLQDAPAPKAPRTRVTRRNENARPSLVPFLFGLVILVAGFWFLRFISNLQRIAPRPAEATASATPSPTAPVPRIVAPRAEPVESPASPAQVAAAAATTTPPVTPTPTIAGATPVPTAIAVATPVVPVARAVEPEVRRAEPVHPEDLVAAQAENAAAEANAPNRVDIRPLKKTYMRVTIDDDPTKPAFERWVSPSDGTVEFRGHRFSVTVLERDAVQIRKNGKIVSNGDTDLRITAQ
ncbi:MAG TPA: helix-turn-helix domain-containing protein [Chthoniobacterales bacterium]|nr:helix-turn-helix domain-containing protein [Chthoniobacterales bacterium]